MRKTAIGTRHLILLFMLVPLVVSLILAANVTYIRLKSMGSLKSSNIFIRGQWLGSQTSAADVDAFVSKYPGANGITLIDTRQNLLNVISYTGWNETKTWSGTPYPQLKEVVDRFHYHGWKVILEVGLGWSGAEFLKSINDQLWLYLNNEHRELNFVNGLGQLRGVEGSDGSGLSDYNYLDYFKNYTTPDSQRNIPVGARYIDVYTSRLKQMITDGSFEWDGWYGTDGWAGLNIEDHYWLYPPQSFWEYTEGAYSKSQWVSHSLQEQNEWASSSYAPILPQNWNSMSNVERATWIMNSSPKSWYYYWQERWAKLWGQINSVFNVRPLGWRFGAMMTQERASTWVQSVVGPIGMFNYTQVYLQNSFSHQWIQSGGIDLPRENAWSAGLVSSRYPEFHTVNYVHTSEWFVKVPISTWKQTWLGEAITYVWKNGTRYRAVDPSCTGFSGEADWWKNGNYPEFSSFMNWIKRMYEVLGRDDLTPLYLGPTYVIPVYKSGISPLYNLNYTFSQYVDVVNLMNTPANLKSDMGTLLVDMSSFQSSEGLTGLKNAILNMYANGSLNLILYSGLFDNRFSSIFNGEGEIEAQATFRMGTTVQGSSMSVDILAQSQLDDANAKWIASGYYGNSYTASYPGVYSNNTGFIPIATYSDGRIGLGIYYDSTSGRLTYLRSIVSPETDLPKAMVNRALYWASDSPVIPSEPLLDVKVFRVGKETILIPMLNVRDINGVLTDYSPISSTLSINASRLGLGSASDYIMYWQSNWNGTNSWTPTDWNNVQVTLEDGADVLVIKPKAAYSQLSTSVFLLVFGAWINSLLLIPITYPKINILGWSSTTHKHL